MRGDLHVSAATTRQAKQVWASCKQRIRMKLNTVVSKPNSMTT